MSDRTDAPPTRISTTPIVLATLVGILAVFGFQIVGTRTLGAEAYAPIGQLWTVYFLGFTMFLLPVEQVVTQRLALAGGDLSALRSMRFPILGAVSASMLLTGLFVAATLDRNFNGEFWYLPASVALAGLYVGFAMTRGITAGQQRLRDYGIAVASESLTRLVVAVVLVSIWPTAASLVVAMLVAAVAGIAGRPWVRSAPRSDIAHESGGGHLAGLVIGTVAAQAILASGPIVVGFLDGTATQVSIVFVSFVLLRGPLTSSYNFLSSALHWITIEIKELRASRVRSRATQILVGGAVAAVGAGAAAAWIGPAVVAGIYGADFRPSRELMAVGAVGVVVAAMALFVGLILIGTQHTRSIALGWSLALAVMIVGILGFPGQPPERFANAFLTGEIAALILLTWRAFHHLSGVEEGQPATTD